MFDHEKLDVYRKAVEFTGRANEIAEAFPRGRHYLADQLQRASLSIVLNIAEGAGKYSNVDKASFYARARGSTTECAAVLDVCVKIRLLSSTSIIDDKRLLERVCSMLTKLIKAQRSAGSPESTLPVNVNAPAPVNVFSEDEVSS
ncbi:MAG TPA: four helix bundle protein [Thermoanaerobaculia bacterium]